MRARAVVLSILSSTAVLVAGYQLGTQGQDAVTTTTQAGPTAQSAGSAPATTAPTTTTPTAPTTTTPTASGSAPATTATATPAPAAASGTSGTFTGAGESTRYGTVQVQITVENGVLTDVTALQLTDHDQRSVSISNRAAPVLRQQVLAAQSANVQGVSGATYTSDGYLRSVQSALDQAGL